MQMVIEKARAPEDIHIAASCHASIFGRRGAKMVRTAIDAIFVLGILSLEDPRKRKPTMTILVLMLPWIEVRY